VPELARAVPEPYVEVHPLLADRLGIEDGTRVLLTGRRGQVAAVAHITDAIRPDTVFMPFHWGGIGGVNRVTSDATDPISGMPEFKVCAVAVRPLSDRAGGPSELTVPTLVTPAREAP
jgi:assimilatory nitrate reductase catalytic subunit